MGPAPFNDLENQAQEEAQKSSRKRIKRVLGKDSASGAMLCGRRLPDCDRVLAN